MTTIIVNNGPTSAKPSTPIPKTPGPKSIQNQSLKQTIRNIAQTFLSHYDEGTVDEFLRSQNYTDVELILFCKAAKIPYSGKNKEDKLESICTFLNKNRRGVMDYIEIVASSGHLMVAGAGAIVATGTLLYKLVQQIKKIGATHKELSHLEESVKQENQGQGQNVANLLMNAIVFILVTCMCWFITQNNEDMKQYNQSVEDLKSSWTSFKNVHNSAKRKRTLSVLRLGQTAKHVHVARTRAKLAKTKKKLYSCNSILSKIKRGLFGGPTQADIQSEVDRLKTTLEVNH